MEQHADVQSGSEVRYEVSRKELPLYCPTRGTDLWSAHPRVYLPLGENDHARCPYCGALYILKD